MGDKVAADELADIVKAAIDDAVDRAIDPLLDDLIHLAKTFEDVADRLREEGRRIDMMKAEMAREARKANGQDVRP